MSRLVVAAMLIGIVAASPGVFLERHDVGTLTSGDAEPLSQGQRLELTDETLNTTRGVSLYQMFKAKPDAFTRIGHPERLQPFYLIPISNCMKVVIQYIVIGFGLSFEPKARRSCLPAWLASMIDCMKGMNRTYGLTSFIFVVLALNSWRHDITHMMESDASGALEHILGACVIVVTSPNFAAAISIWSALDIESPGKLLGLEPKDPAMHVMGFPLSPFGYVSPGKWLLAVVLLPYSAFVKVFNFASGLYIISVSCAWAICCFVKCQCFHVCGMCCCGFLRKFAGTICCEFWIVVTVCTLFLWGYARSSVAYYAYDLVVPQLPVFYLGFLQIWSLLIAPTLFVGLYGLGDGASMEDIQKGMAESSYSSPICLEEEDKRAIIEYNSTELQKNFNIEQGHANPDSLKDARLAIVYKTLQALGNIPIVQIGVVFTARMIMNCYDGGDGSSIQAGAFSAYATTLEERHLSSYLDYLKEAESHALLSGMNVLWNII